MIARNSCGMSTIHSATVDSLQASHVTVRFVSWNLERSYWSMVRDQQEYSVRLSANGIQCTSIVHRLDLQEKSHFGGQAAEALRLRGQHIKTEYVHPDNVEIYDETGHLSFIPLTAG